jgi:hypothetical protein
MNSWCIDLLETFLLLVILIVSGPCVNETHDQEIVFQHTSYDTSIVYRQVTVKMYIRLVLHAYLILPSSETSKQTDRQKRRYLSMAALSDSHWWLRRVYKQIFNKQTGPAEKTIMKQGNLLFDNWLIFTRKYETRAV